MIVGRPVHHDIAVVGGGWPDRSEPRSRGERLRGEAGPLNSGSKCKLEVVLLCSAFILFFSGVSLLLLPDGGGAPRPAARWTGNAPTVTWTLRLASAPRRSRRMQTELIALPKCTAESAILRRSSRWRCGGTCCPATGAARRCTARSRCRWRYAPAGHRIITRNSRTPPGRVAAPSRSPLRFVASIPLNKSRRRDALITAVALMEGQPAVCALHW